MIGIKVGFEAYLFLTLAEFKDLATKNCPDHPLLKKTAVLNSTELGFDADYVHIRAPKEGCDPNSQEYHDYDDECLIILLSNECRITFVGDDPRYIAVPATEIERLKGTLFVDDPSVSFAA
jgi:hypothetical protein